MRKPKPNLFEHLENARQQQIALMARFSQAQARITQVEERLQALYAHQQDQAANRSDEASRSGGSFLPEDGDLEMEAAFSGGEQAEEEQETERLVPLRPAQAARENEASIEATADLEQA